MSIIPLAMGMYAAYLFAGAYASSIVLFTALLVASSILAVEPITTESALARSMVRASKRLLIIGALAAMLSFFLIDFPQEVQYTLLAVVLGMAVGFGIAADVYMFFVSKGDSSGRY